MGVRLPLSPLDFHLGPLVCSPSAASASPSHLLGIAGSPFPLSGPLGSLTDEADSGHRPRIDRPFLDSPRGTFLMDKDKKSTGRCILDRPDRFVAPLDYTEKLILAIIGLVFATFIIVGSID